MVAIAITLMVALVLGATTLSNLTMTNAKRTVVTRQTLQTYYVAEAGIQEALATRMLPRSNYLNFMNPRPAGVNPYLPPSGLVFQDPQTQQGLIGVYRYIIVGGDPSRRADGSYYDIPAGPPFAVGPNTTQNAANPIPRLVTFQTSPPDSPFYVISQGFTCKTPGGAIGVDQFAGAPTTDPANIGVNPACQAPNTLDQITLVTRVAMESEVAGTLDRVNRTLEFKDATSINLPGQAFIPGQGWQQNNVNFPLAWQYAGNTAGETPVRLTRIVFFDFGPNRIYQSVDLAGNPAQTTVANPVPVNASMMLYFDGPFDYRSLSANLTGTRADLVYERNLAGCKLGDANGGSPPAAVNDMNNCAIQLYGNPIAPGVGGTQYTGLQVVPILPYLTKVLLLAPLGNNVSSGTQYEIRVREDALKSFSLASGPVNQYLIRFQTCPVSGGPAPCPP
jgi:hypothetical protein